MSQYSLVLANTSTPTFRANANNALNTLVTLNAGVSAPSVTVGYMLWADTTTNLLKMRNAANSAWITLGPLASWQAKGAAIASAATVVLGTDGALAHVTGSVTITALSGLTALPVLVFDAALVLTHSSTLILRDGASVTTRAGAVFGFVNEGGGVFREVFRAFPGEFPSLGLTAMAIGGFPLL